MTDLEELLRRAMQERVTYISIDSASGGMVRVGAWKAFSHYTIAHDADPVVALTEALTRAMAPKGATDLTSLLG